MSRHRSRTPIATPTELTDTDERSAFIVDDNEGIGVAAMKNLVFEHASTCPAARGYQRAMGAILLLTLISGAGWFLLRAAIRNDTRGIVEQELDRRWPTLQRIAGIQSQVVPWQMFPPARAETK